MRLVTLISELPDDQLERLEEEHVGEGQKISRNALCETLETVLRSYSFVRRFVWDRFPPTFAILELLLESPGFAIGANGFKDAVEERTRQLVERVTAGELVGRDDSLRLYRRVLLEARRNDRVLDASETAILAVLREELGIRVVEHFLLEHHPDFHEFWRKGHGFLDQMNALRSCGLVFAHEGNLLLAEDVAPTVRQALGFEMSNHARRRVFNQLTSAEIASTLEACALKSSGSREERLARLLDSYVPTSEALRTLNGQRVRDLCRDLGAAVSGAKEELIERLVRHMLHDLDVKMLATEGAAAVVEPEPRALDENRFRDLFSSLRGEDLSDILVGIESSRVTGDKETKVQLLAKSRFAEASLLMELTNKALEETLDRLRLRTIGSKGERIQRLIDNFKASSSSTDTAS